jgi:hypothetical protein
LRILWASWMTFGVRPMSTTLGGIFSLGSTMPGQDSGRGRNADPASEN